MPTLLCLLIATLLITPASTARQGYVGPNSLGPFRIDKDSTIKSLFDMLGLPPSTKENVFCYQSKDNKAFLVLTRMSEAYDRKVAGTATLSDFRNCTDKPVVSTSADLARWTTNQGIGLGSTTEEVQKTFGRPSKEDRIEGAKYRWVIHGDRSTSQYSEKRSSEIGSTVLIYQGVADDLRIAEFGIRKGRVVWISLSKNE